MTDGPFRNDQDAALARVGALEDELAREKAETARLRALLAEQHEPATTAAPPQAAQAAPTETAASARRSRRGARRARRALAWCAKRLPVLVVVGLLLIKPIVDCHDTGLWTQVRVENTYRMLRWRLMTEIGACVRATEVRAATLAGLDAETADPRKPNSRAGEIDVVRKPDGRRKHHRSDRRGEHDYFSGCVAALTADDYWNEFRDQDVAAHHDATLAHFPGAVQGPLRAWIDRERELADAATRLSEYYGKRDYLDDDYRAGPTLWADLRAALAARDAAVATVRATALPAIHELMRSEQAAYERRAGRDALWWRIDLGYRAHVAGQDDPQIAGAVREPTRHLLEAAKQAPLDVRRAVRALTALDRMAGTEPYPAWSTIESLAEWQSQSLWDDDGDRHDHAAAPTPPDPPMPAGCGGCYNCAR